MGVNKLVRCMREYDYSNPDVTLLAKKLLDAEEAHIHELRGLL